MKPTDLGDPLTFSTITMSLTSLVFNEMSQRLLNGIKFSTDIHGDQRMNPTDFSSNATSR